MKFKFTKEVFEDYSTGRRKYRRIYSIIDDSDKIAGQFWFHGKAQTIYIDDREISLKIVSKFLKKSAYLLIDKPSDLTVGEYAIFSNANSSFYAMGASYPPIGSLTWNGNIFNFKRIPTEVRQSFFKQKTWGYFKFRLEAIKGPEIFEYSLKMDIPIWSKARFTKYRPFTGSIESNSKNIGVLLAGFYLMEIEFEYEDSRADG